MKIVLLLILCYVFTLGDTKVISTPNSNTYITYGEYTMGASDSIVSVKQHLTKEARLAVLEHLDTRVESHLTQYSNIDLGKRTEIKTKVITPSLTALKALEEGYVKEGVYFVKYEVTIDQNKILEDVRLATRKYDSVVANPTNPKLSDLQQQILLKEKERIEKEQEYAESMNYAIDVYSSIINNNYTANMTVEHEILETKTYDESYEKWVNKRSAAHFPEVVKVEKYRTIAKVKTTYTIDKKGYEEVRALLPNNKAVDKIGNIVAGVLTFGLSAVKERKTIQSQKYKNYGPVLHYYCAEDNLVSDIRVSMIYEFTDRQTLKRYIDEEPIGKCTKFTITEEIEDVEKILPIEVIGFKITLDKIDHLPPKPYAGYGKVGI